MGGEVGMEVINKIMKRRGEMNYERMEENVRKGNEEDEKMIEKMKEKYNEEGMDGEQIEIEKI